MIQRRRTIHILFLWFLIAGSGVIFTACNLPLGDASIDIEAERPDTTSTEPVSGVPTIDPTAATLQLAVYPGGARTGQLDLDLIIDAVLAHDMNALRGLTSYIQTGCTQFEGLGGPPKCQEDEAEGTVVEVVPFLGAEGTHQRVAEFENWIGPDVLGLLAVYKTSTSIFSDENYPAGDYAIMFLNRDGISDVTLQVRQGRVVRFDYGFPGSVETKLAADAGEMVLPLTFNPIPTPVSWIRFLDPHDRFVFHYPPTLTLSEGTAEDYWRLGEQIEFFILQPGEMAWVTCFDQPLGDCPAVYEEGITEMNGLPARRVKGYFGSVGGNTPQEFLTYIFKLGEAQLVFAVYALPFDAPLQDIQHVWPLEGMAYELFERTVGTVVLHDSPE